jgi:hypothetical protein
MERTLGSSGLVAWRRYCVWRWRGERWVEQGKGQRTLLTEHGMAWVSVWKVEFGIGLKHVNALGTIE